MAQRILVLLGHPDPAPDTYCRALARAYADGAREAGHAVREIDLSVLDVPVLRSREDYRRGEPPPDIRAAQDSIRWCEHLVIVYPLWQGMVPALLKAFLEQVFRPAFLDAGNSQNAARPALRGRSARLVVTMGMPAFAWRWFFFAHGGKALRRSVLGLVGFGPIRDTVIGDVESPVAARRERWLRSLRALGTRAA